MRLGNSVSCAPLAAQFNLLEYFEALHHAEMLLKFSKRYLTSQGYRTLNFFLPPKAMRKNTRIHDRIGISGMSSKSHRTRGSRLVRDCSKLIDIATQRLKDDSCEITALFIISFFIYIIDPRRLQPFERSPISRTIQFNRRKSSRRVRFVLSRR